MRPEWIQRMRDRNRRAELNRAMQSQLEAMQKSLEMEVDCLDRHFVRMRREKEEALKAVSSSQLGWLSGLKIL